VKSNDVQKAVQSCGVYGFAATLNRFFWQASGRRYTTYCEGRLIVITEKDVRAALSTVRFPGYSRDIVSFGMVSSVAIQGSNVTVVLSVTSEDRQKLEELHAQATKAVSKLSGVTSVTVDLQPPAGVAPEPEAPAKPKGLPNVKRSIAVGSGKGGVGKTTVAVNLAVALAERGLRIGLLDADVYGPNVPRMMGLSGQPEANSEGKILPLENHGVRVMSLGFFVNADTPVIWRGPMVGKLIEQFVNDVEWGDLDILVIDLPPGTGDAQISLSQMLPLDGVVIVSTPQKVALEDAMKGLAMFQKVNVPIVGVIENMSYFVCPHCNERTNIFDNGQAARACKRVGVPFLGEIPLDPSIRQGSDDGIPALKVAPDSAQAAAFRVVAAHLAGLAKPS
jgi:ATP-binding protein involved in chromosome partitioning